MAAASMCSHPARPIGSSVVSSAVANSEAARRGVADVSGNVHGPFALVDCLCDGTAVVEGDRQLPAEAGVQRRIIGRHRSDRIATQPNDRGIEHRILDADNDERQFGEEVRGPRSAREARSAQH